MDGPRREEAFLEDPTPCAERSLRDCRVPEPHVDDVEPVLAVLGIEARGWVVGGFLEELRIPPGVGTSTALFSACTALSWYVHRPFWCVHRLACVHRPPQASTQAAARVRRHP